MDVRIYPSFYVIHFPFPSQNNKESHSGADNLKRYYGWNYQDVKDVLNPPGGWSKTNKDIILLFCIAIEI